MGKIKKILENELLGGTESTDVYPITSTKAVYTSENKKLFDSYVKDVSCESSEEDVSLIFKSESDTNINTITIPAATAEKAGVMSAEDKAKLNEAKKLVIGEGETIDVTLKIGYYWNSEKREYYSQKDYNSTERINVTSGNVIRVTGAGGNNALLYCYYDSEDRLLKKAAGSETNAIIVISQDGYIICSTASTSSLLIEKLPKSSAVSQLSEDLSSVHSDIESNTSEIFDLTSITSSDLSSGYYYNGGLFIGDTHPDTPKALATWGCTKVRVSKGSIINIQTKGGSSARAYALTDLNGKVLSLADAGINTINNPVEITVEKDGYLYINHDLQSNDIFSVIIKASKIKLIIDNILNKKSYDNSILSVGYFYNLGSLAIGDIAPIDPKLFREGDPTWGCIKLAVTKGMSVSVQTKGGSAGRAYALTDKNRRILILADAGLDTTNNPATIQVNQDGYLYVNCTPSTEASFSIVTDNSINTKVEALKYDVNELKNIAPPVPHMFNPPLNLTMPKLKVLDIGNSYTVDSTNYLPQLIESAGIDVSDMCLYTAVRGGASFKNWCDVYNDKDTTGYSIDKKFGGIDADISGSNTGGVGEKFRNTLINNEWDLIIIHQVSSYAPYYDMWEENSPAGYLSQFIRIIRKHQPKATIGFLIVHSYWSGYGSNEQGSSYERWKLIAESAKKLRANYGIDFIIPYGTAIQNIRASSLNTEHELTNDGTHCAVGLGDYTAACAYFQALIAPRYGVSILGNSYRISVEQTGTYPESEVSVTDENAPIAQKAAFLASYNWFDCINPEEVDL